MNGSPTLADRIASSVLTQYRSLPKKYTPTKDGSGISNWTILSGIVLEYPDGKLECVSLATGLKCLPASKVSTAKGRVLHDSHAEILALRVLNYVLLKDCEQLLKTEDELPESRILARRENDHDGMRVFFAIREGIKLHMYCSEAPCGDASMELIMEKQDDATPWTSTVSGKEGLPGRGHFDQLGAVRRKPSRADSPQSLSKSCSDKLAMKQCLSLLSSHTSVFISPENAYLSSLVLPESQIHPVAIERCFGVDGRLRGVKDIKFESGYSFQACNVLPTSENFQYSKKVVEMGGKSCKPSSMTIIWSSYSQEIIVNGVLQGRKQTDPKCASTISRARLATITSQFLRPETEAAMTYVDLKRGSPQLKDRRRMKQRVINHVLPGWIVNTEDDFELTIS